LLQVVARAAVGAAAAGVSLLTIFASGASAQGFPCEGAGGATSAHVTSSSVTVYCADGSHENYRFAPIGIGGEQ
jgi:hypothetical protein